MKYDVADTQTIAVRAKSSDNVQNVVLYMFGEYAINGVAQTAGTNYDNASGGFHKAMIKGIMVRMDIRYIHWI